MTRSRAVGLGLFLAGLLITLGVFGALHLVVGLPWGAALAVAALAGTGGVVGSFGQSGGSRA